MNKHLNDFLTGSGAHHVDMAKLHKTAMDGEAEGSSAFEFHKRSMELHTSQGEACCACAKGLGETRKAAGIGDEIVPSLISGVTPTPSPEFRAVPRFGAPHVSEKPVVPEEFEKLVAVDDED